MISRSLMMTFMKNLPLHYAPEKPEKASLVSESMYMFKNDDKPKLFWEDVRRELTVGQEGKAREKIATKSATGTCHRRKCCFFVNSLEI